MTPAAGAVFAPGFFASGPVHVALAVGTLVAAVSAIVGTFTVVRGQSFAGHAFGDMGTTGGAGAALVGAGPLWGFLVAGLAGAGLLELVGIQRARGRDLATGIVFGASLGLSALFLYLATTDQSTTGLTLTVLFGSAFAIAGSTVPLVVVLSAVAVALVALLYRPLLLSSLHAELAAARGVPVRLVGFGYLVALAVAVALTSVAIGTILSTALLIGPAATALRVSRRPGRAMLLAALLGIGAMWIGIVLSYDSFTWPPYGHGWPISFFVVALVLVFYLAAGLIAGRRRRAPR